VVKKKAVIGGKETYSLYFGMVKRPIIGGKETYYRRKRD
jgi:hypothetical protein